MDLSDFHCIKVKLQNQTIPVLSINSTSIYVIDFFYLWVLPTRQIFGSSSLNIQFYISRNQLCVTKNSFKNNPFDSYIATEGLCLNMEWHGAIE